jgi:hypothetical protein
VLNDQHLAVGMKAEELNNRDCTINFEAKCGDEESTKVAPKNESVLGERTDPYTGAPCLLINYISLRGTSFSSVMKNYLRRSHFENAEQIQNFWKCFDSSKQRWILCTATSKKTTAVHNKPPRLIMRPRPLSFSSVFFHFFESRISLKVVTLQLKLCNLGMHVSKRSDQGGSVHVVQNCMRGRTQDL